MRKQNDVNVKDYDNMWKINAKFQMMDQFNDLAQLCSISKMNKNTNKSQ
jgi:hypothetical protein